MRFCKLSFGVLAITMLTTQGAMAQSRLKASEAKDHVGETATVCGSVESTHYASSSNRQPTFLNIDAPYPKQIFTIVIWGSDRSKFGRPEAEYGHKRVCITGRISEYRGVPEVIATEPSQIKVEQ
jgi:DNA/RNA endonuclease YhcR with UshA esterase domain